jgi:translation initiation factor IF-1
MVAVSSPWLRFQNRRYFAVDDGAGSGASSRNRNDSGSFSHYFMPPRPSGRRRRSQSTYRGPAKKNADGEEKAVEVEGEISAVLAGTMFKVKLQSGHEVLAHISGKMRKRFIRLVVGDKVKMEMSPYDLSKARIVFRLG